MAPTSPTNGGRSVGIVRSRTQATEFVWIKSENPVILSVIHHRQNILVLNQLFSRPQFNLQVQLCEYYCLLELNALYTCKKSTTVPRKTAAIPATGSAGL
jgi:hypothetical protein